MMCYHEQPHKEQLQRCWYVAVQLQQCCLLGSDELHGVVENYYSVLASLISCILT